MITMSEKTKNKITTWVISVVIGALIGRFYTEATEVSRGVAAVATYPGIRAGVLVSGLTAGLEIFLIAGPLGYWLFRRPFYQALLLRLLAHWVVITSALMLNDEVTQGLLPGPDSGYGFEWFLTDTLIAFAVLAFALFFIQMRTLIGGRTLINLITGRYYSPVIEERLFLLIDVVGSTKLAKQLGDEAFYSYLSDFFKDIDPVIFENRGEVYSYIGDAVIVTWPLKKFRGSHRVLETILQCRQRMEKRTPRYIKRYGVKPEFRAVLHGGEVMVGEYGGYRRQITYLGDAINTTSRLEGLCKDLESEALLSEAAAEMVTVPSSVQLRDQGFHQLKGLDHPIKVYDLAYVA